MHVYLLILLTTLCTIAGQLVLKRAVIGLRPLLSQGPLEFILGAAMSPLVYAALALQAAGYVVWLFVISKEKLSVAFAISGSTFYIIMAATSWLLYDEKIGPVQWLGLIMISAGVALVMTGNSPGTAA